MAGIVVVDVETTDFKPGFILEIAAVLTNENMEPLGEFHTVVRPLLFGTKSFYKNIDPIVIEMHKKNGLWEDVDSNKAVDIEDAEKDFCKFLSAAKSEFATLHFMGNSLAKVDFPFMEALTPAVFGYMHHRSIDVSGIELWLGMVRGEKISFPKAGSHRAMDDVKNCIEQHRFLTDLCKYGGKA